MDTAHASPHFIPPTVAALLTPEPATLHAGDSIDKAAREMVLCEVRHLPVVDGERRLLGIVSQRDVIARGPDRSGTVGSLMSTDVISIAPDALAYEAAFLILHHRIGCLPVVDGAGRLVGIVTETDLVRVAYTLLGGAVPLDQLEREEAERT